MKAKLTFYCILYFLISCDKKADSNHSMHKLLHESDTETYFLQIAEAEPSNAKGSSEGKSRFEVRNYSFAEVLSQISKLCGDEIVSDFVILPGRFDVLMLSKNDSPLPFDTLINKLATTFQLSLQRENIEKTAIKLSVKPGSPNQTAPTTSKVTVTNGLLSAENPSLWLLVKHFNATQHDYFFTEQDTITLNRKIECDLRDRKSLATCINENGLLTDTIKVKKIRYLLARK